MKKFLKTILFLCALSSLAYAEDDAMAILNKKRAEIEKAEKAKAKLAKEAEEKARKEAEEQAKLAEKAAKEQARLAEEEAKSQVVEVVEAPAEAVVATESLNPQDEQEAKELGISTSEASSLAEIEAMVKAKKAEKAKPKTEAEKLEATRKEALEKLDFYERVVRSVAREEAEVAGYYEIMNDEQAKATEAPVTEEVAPVVETTVQQ
ncbi:hypothetical protein [Fusobacterium pseudoperiodonticum]|uniref:hypothetical protein n=1 Tax=Fusobacterium pseudoperiodonticum TaxID=2663009 RepID=UPI000C1BF48E|nr:hypothetical protein [Fusobacterium pseudoperiodonticum]ATV68025.1 hypothetical protein CTM92_04925 [Fusobacterium pseudoperiodonticum]